MEAAEIRNQNRLPQRPEHFGALQEILRVNGVARGEVAQGHFHEHRRFLAGGAQFRAEGLARPFQHVEGRARDGAEAAALHEDGLLVEHLGPLRGFPGGGEHRGFGQALLYELERHEAVVHADKRRAGEPDHVHFHALPGEVVQQRGDQRRRLALEKRAVDEVHAEHAQRFLLMGVLLFQQADVQNDFARLAVKFRLEANAHPAVTLLLPRKAVRSHGVGEREERPLRAVQRVEALAQQGELVIQHRLQPLPADVAFGGAVNRVAHRHIVGGHRLGDGARCAADVEKPPRDFLSGADLGEGAVATGVAVDLRGLLLGAGRGGSHGGRMKDEG